VNNPMKEHQELGDNILYLVCDEYLLGIELYLVFLKIKLTLYFGKIQDARQIERIIHIQVNPEQWIVGKWIQRLVEIQIIFILQVCGSCYPQRLYIVDHVVLLDGYLFSIIVLCFFFLCAKYNGSRKELTIFLKDLPDAIFFQKFSRIVGDVHH